VPPELIIEEQIPGIPADDSRILEVEVEGYKITIGQNDLSNERMVSEHKSKHPRCLWLHALRAVGSHLICCIEGKGQIPFGAFKQVGKLAIEYSRSRGTTVRFASLENVFKPDGASAGIWQARPYRTFDI
jgi:predicted ribosome quality control (RQC) complex YloA/Tae2 family protein